MNQSKLFIEEIRESVLIGDGAIGTELLARGAPPESGIESLNITSPDLVISLHKDYIAAGSRVIETNTFAANRPSLQKHGIDHRLRDVILAATSHARQAAENGVYVAGSVGPLPVVDGEPISASDQAEFFTEQIGFLLEGGVDVLIFESFPSFEDLSNAVSSARLLTDIPIVAQMAFGSGGVTADGEMAAMVGEGLRSVGADVIGANCGYGVPSITDAAKQMRHLGLPMSAYPNAGFPEKIEGRLVYFSSPDYLAQRALDLTELGVRLIGGCCGTGPDTIREIARALAHRCRSVRMVSAGKTEQEAPPSEIEVEPRPVVHLGRILVELDPPSGPEAAHIVECAKLLKEAGVDAITVADNPLASARADSVAVAAILQRECGLPTIPHLTGRDRNRIALQSTIMAAHMLDVRALLCVTGDPVRMCQDPNTSGVFDLTSVGLVKLVADFNDGSRADASHRTAFSIGVALNPNVRGMAGQIDKLKRKVDAGAHFALTQPIFSEERLNTLQEELARAEIDIPVYIGVLPLTSRRNAEFLHNEVPGIVVPEDIRNTLARYEKVVDQCAAGVEIAARLVDGFSRRVHGFYMIAPRNRVELIVPLVAAAGVI